MTFNVPEKPRKCLTIDDIQIGDRFEKEYTVTYEMVKMFSEISGDWNPAHHDAEYAKGTVFKQQIAHGTISVAQFSGVFGMDLPGLGAIWMNQSVSYKAPVLLDKPYTAIVEAIEVKKRSVVFRTYVNDEEGNLVLDGEGELMPIPVKVKTKMDVTPLLD